MLSPRDEQRQLWIDRIEAQRNSGLSITEFCKLHQLHQLAFYNWRKQLATTEPQHGRFAAVELEPATTLRLQLPVSTNTRWLNTILSVKRRTCPVILA